jgi:PAS domain-containing protein
MAILLLKSSSSMKQSVRPGDSSNANCAGDPFVSYEAQPLRKAGSEVAATISLTPLIDHEDGHYRGSVGLIIDDTERHMHEAERQMLTALVQHSPDFIGVTDLHGTTIFVNRAGQSCLVWRPTTA